MVLFKRFRGASRSWMRCWSITVLRVKFAVKICLIDETGAGDGALSVLAARWGLMQDDDNPMALVMTCEHLELRKRDEPNWRHLRRFRRRGDGPPA
jgi:16S rRNA (guanine1516-N2)-methyltransferase